MGQAMEVSDTREAAPRRPAAGSAEAGERTCIVTRRALPKRALIRFVVGPEGRVVPDMAERLPGRGLWVSATREAVETACRRNLFAKAARANVTVEPGLGDEVERQLAARALGLLGFARRAGSIAIGHDQVRALLASGRAAVLIEARDAAEDAAARMTARAGALPLVDCFGRAELGFALGRDEAVHVALEAGSLAASFLLAVERLRGFRQPEAAAVTVD
ncbi:MAG: RNA-binding protein [Alphaproteobacteria bacterium]